MQQNKLYNRIKLTFTIAEYIIIFIYLIILVCTPLSRQIYNYIISLPFTNTYIHLLLFLFACGVVISIITIPLSFINDFIIEHIFKLSNQSIVRYIFENLKALLVSLVIYIPIMLVFYIILRKTGRLWWLPVSIVMFLFSILLSRIAPVVILPLFYKLTPVDNEELSEKIK
ncbi:M48 family peptidase, partial [Spirochaetota bacterium]